MSDAPIYALLPFNPADGWEIEFSDLAGAQPASVSSADLTRLDAALTTAVARLNERYEQANAAWWDAHPDSSYNRAFLLIDLPRYVRQYLACRTPAGAVLVLVKLLLHPRPDWRTQVRWVLDGGNAHVDALYEPALNKLHWLRPHGSA